MQSSYRTYEEAKSDLLSSGFIRHISCVNGAELFIKTEKVDDAMGGYTTPCMVSIQHHWVAPKWGDNLNYFTINFM